MMMKLRLIAVAAAALAGLSTAHAIPVDQLAGAEKIYIAGASALRLSIGAHVASICNNDLDVYFSKAGAAPAKDGDDHRAYACTLKDALNGFAAGTKVVVYKRDLGGSGQGVAPIAVQGTSDARRLQAHLKIVNDATCVRTANASPVTDFQLPSYVCSTTESVVSHAGISDVEPNLLMQTVNLGSGSAVDISALTSKPFVQALFGVIVNKSAYAALQKAQGLQQVDSPLLGGVPDASQKALFEANIPSVPSTFARSAFTSGATGLASSARGWNLLIDTVTDPKVVGKTVNVCRRAAGSGTQAASNAFFANNPCGQGFGATSNVATATGTIGVKTNSIAVVENSSSGAVETCVGSTVENAVHATDGKAYGIAVIGRENNPFANGGDKAYRYVKLDGNAPSRANALTGAYPFVYESTIQWNSNTVAPGSTVEAFLNGIATAAKPASLLLVDADTQEGVMSPPSSYGTRVSLSSDELKFASRVARSAGNSCSVLKLNK